MASETDNPSLSNGFSGSEIESVVNAVMEKKFIKYLEQDKEQRKAVKISEQDFIDEINIIKSSVMSNQKGKEGEHTSVEKIRSLQDIYKFRSASKL